jgi:hypothetical protein
MFAGTVKMAMMKKGAIKIQLRTSMCMDSEYAGSVPYIKNGIFCIIDEEDGGEDVVDGEGVRLRDLKHSSSPDFSIIIMKMFGMPIPMLVNCRDCPANAVLTVDHSTTFESCNCGFCPHAKGACGAGR